MLKMHWHLQLNGLISADHVTGQSHLLLVEKLVCREEFWKAYSVRTIHHCKLLIHWVRAADHQRLTLMNKLLQCIYMNRNGTRDSVSPLVEVTKWLLTLKSCWVLNEHRQSWWRLFVRQVLGDDKKEPWSLNDGQAGTPGGSNGLKAASKCASYVELKWIGFGGRNCGSNKNIYSDLFGSQIYFRL